MRVIKIFILLSLFFVCGCKKDPWSDYRSAYTGTYQMNVHRYGGYGTSISFTTFDTTFVTLVNVSKGSEKNTVIFQNNASEIVVTENGDFKGQGIEGRFWEGKLEYTTVARSPASHTTSDYSGYKQ
jgi:hypothetical protein